MYVSVGRRVDGIGETFFKSSIAIIFTETATENNRQQTWSKRNKNNSKANNYDILLINYHSVAVNPFQVQQNLHLLTEI